MRFFRVIGAIVLVGLLLALGVGIYQAGVIAGGAGTATAAAPAYWYGPWFGPWFGFGLFHLFGFLLFILLIVGLVRLVFWGGRGRRGWGPGYGPGPGGWSGPNGQGGPMGRHGDWEQRMRDYHDRLHASGPSGSTSGSGAPGAPSGTVGSTPDDPRAAG